MLRFHCFLLSFEVWLLQEAAVSQRGDDRDPEMWGKLVWSQLQRLLLLAKESELMGPVNL